MQEYFKTPKGTELPLLNLKGKRYLQAAHRLVWFREERPNWSIQTEALSVSPEASFFKATISDDLGRVIATGHKTETVKGFPDHTEKAETGAIARALAACGYGTQFAPELDEGDRLADSPTAPAHRHPEPSVSRTAEVREIPGRTAGGLTQAQLGRLSAIRKKAGIADTHFKQMAEGFGIKSSDTMTKSQYEMLCSTLENFKGPA